MFVCFFFQPLGIEDKWWWYQDTSQLDRRIYLGWTKVTKVSYSIFLIQPIIVFLSVTYLHHLEDLLQTKIGLLNKRFEVQFLSVPKIDWCLDLMIKSTIIINRCYKLWNSIFFLNYWVCLTINLESAFITYFTRRQVVINVQ